MGYWEEDYRDKVPFSTHLIKGTYYQHDFWPWSLGGGSFPGFSIIKSLYYPFSIRCSSKGSHYAWPTIKRWGVVFPHPHALEDRYLQKHLEFFYMEICLVIFQVRLFWRKLTKEKIMIDRCVEMKRKYWKQ